MKNVWVLSVKTDFLGDLNTDIFAFESFADARTKMRDVLRALSHDDNAMFDKNGELKNLKEYLDNRNRWDNDDDDPDSDPDDDDYDDDERPMGIGMLNDFYNALKAVFAGEDSDYALDEGKYSDYANLSMYSENGAVRLFGDYDGPWNEIEPYIDTNTFSMYEEKDYHLYIEDNIEATVYSFLHVDLKKVPVE